MLLRVVGSCCARFEIGKTFSYVQRSPDNVGSCWPTMLRPSARGVIQLEYSFNMRKTIKTKKIFKQCSNNSLEQQRVDVEKRIVLSRKILVQF